MITPLLVAIKLFPGVAAVENDRTVSWARRDELSTGGLHRAEFNVAVIAGGVVAQSDYLSGDANAIGGWYSVCVSNEALPGSEEQNGIR